MAGPGEKQSGLNYGRITAVVSAYFLISISMVFLNKLLFSDTSRTKTVDAPLFVTWFQCVVTIAIQAVLGHVGQHAAPGSFFKQFPKIEYDPTIGMQVGQLSLMFVGMITFNNLCLKYVEVSFYNVARSLTIVFNVIFSYVFLKQPSSWRVIATLLVVVSGFWMGAEGEINFSLIGTIFGVGASCFVALNSIMTKRMQSVVSDTWKLSLYNNINASLLFLPLIIVTGEIDSLIVHTDVLQSTGFWMMMIMGGVFGFAIGIVTIMQVNVTSPLTHNISGTVKASVQTVLAFYIFGNQTTLTNIAGIVVVLIGSLAYAWVRIQEGNAAAPPKAPSSAPASGKRSEA